MKHRFFAIGLMMMVCSAFVFAKEINYVGQSNIEKGQFEQAQLKIQNAVSKDPNSCEAYYALSNYYIASANPDYNIDKAYRYALKAEKCFNNADGKPRKKLVKKGFSTEAFNLLMDKICTIALQRAYDSSSVEEYQNFLNYFDRASDQLKAKAINNRNIVAYSKAVKINTIEAYTNFVEMYPGASQVDKANDKIFVMAFNKAVDVKSPNAYLNYALIHPESPHADEAKRRAQLNYRSRYNDIKWAAAKGRVKKIIETVPETSDGYAHTIVYSFDINGKLTSVVKDSTQLFIRRNADGQIIYLYDEYPCEFCPDESTVEMGTHYTYDYSGNITGESVDMLECSEEIKNQYADNSVWRTSAEKNSLGDCDDSSKSYVYSYENIDTEGNWKKQTVTRTVYGVEENVTNQYVVSRQITYWSYNDILNQYYEDNNLVYKIVETMPEFPGGSLRLLNYISENVHYPEAAKADAVQGIVTCEFVVEKNGSISQIQIVKSSGDRDLDNEAIRVIRSMPTWNPGKNRGEPVRVAYTIPINFRLEKDNN